MPKNLSSLHAAVDEVLARIDGPIVLGLPLGIGKPNAFVNALYRRVAADPSRHLTILTALSLEVPEGKSDLERAFLGPLVERVFKDYPDLEYVKASRAGKLPPNIEVREFFMKTGDYLHNVGAQQQHICTNYTFAARDIVLQGVNVLAQAVAMREVDGVQQLSFSCNPDLSAELAERCAAADQPLLKVAVVNRALPYMLGGAEVAPDFFDLVLDCKEGTHTLFAPPNAKVSTADYAIGLHASSLVRDGGTLQIGIGSLGDAIAQSLILRERSGEEYARMLAELCPQGLEGRELGAFEQGLYGCSEMFVNGFLALIETGIVRRRVYADLATQRAVDEGRVKPEDLAGGVYMTGGFFLGPGAFYEALRGMDDAQRAAIDMTRIDFINQLDSPRGEAVELKRAQRRDARFMNTVMKMTILGAAASDALEDGGVVSGVGGQYNFVAQAHALPGARSILMLRSCHETSDGPVSNIVARYGHCTIPRTLRDIVVTEYGIADLRGQTDAEVVKRLIAIADSRFQPGLLREARKMGKLKPDWELPEHCRHNTPQALDAKLHPFTERGLLPGFPFGTDLTQDEIRIVAALRRLKKSTQHPVDLVSTALKSVWEGREAPPEYLKRLGLDEARGFKALLLKKLFAGNL
jgi:acyl-CoA hydrolase